MITPRENLLRVFRHETPEWLPIAGHVDPYNQPNREGMDPAFAAALGEVKWAGTATVLFSRELGLDIMDFYRAPLRLTRRQVTAESVTEGDTTTTTWHTPAGDLREVRRLCRDDTGAVSSYCLEHMVKSPRDLEALAAIFEDEVIELDAEAQQQGQERRALIGDDGMMMASLPGTPLGMMYRVYSGVETLIYLWADAPAALRDLFAVMERNYLRQYELAAQSDLDVLIGMDDTSTTIISPKMFAEYNLELTDARAAVAHASGKLYFHHSCGLIRNLLPLYRQTAMDGVHAFTVPPVGDVTVAEGRRLLGDRITILAGVKQLAEPMNDRAAVRRSIHQMVQEGQPWDHFILCVAAYPHRTMEQTRFVVECCREAAS